VRENLSLIEWLRRLSNDLLEKLLVRVSLKIEFRGGWD
jgi:hypothetical protein